MSPGNVELHRRSVSAFNSRDAEAYVALTDPEIELHSVFAAVGGASYRGHDGVRRWFRDLHEAWGDGVRFEVDAYYELAPHTLATGVLRGRGQQSGAEVALMGLQALKWHNGLLVFYKAYTDRDECLADLGVSEGELTPTAP